MKVKNFKAVATRLAIVMALFFVGMSFAGAQSFVSPKQAIATLDAQIAEMPNVVVAPTAEARLQVAFYQITERNIADGQGVEEAIGSTYEVFNTRHPEFAGTFKAQVIALLSE